MLITKFISSDLYLISPLIILFLGALFILFTGVFKKDKEPAKRIVTGFGLITLTGTWLSSFLNFGLLKGGGRVFFEEALLMDSFSFWTGSAIILASVFSLFLFQQNKFILKTQYTNFVFLFLSSLVGAFTILYSNSLLVLFVGIELLSLPIYMMIILTRDKNHSKESAIKYYILGSVASAFFLLGVVFIFGTSSAQFGSEVFLNIIKLKEASAQLVQVDHLFLVGSTFMLLASLLKVGVFPFHNWIPDVYQGANSAVTYYLVTVSKIAALIVLIKLMMAGFLMRADFFQIALQWIVVLSMIFGSLFALQQTSIKRMLAYSGVAHSGYMMMSFMGFGYDGEGAVDAFVFYLFPYVFFSGVIFCVLQLLENIKGAEISLFDLNGLAKKRPVESFLLLIGVFGVSGMPPFIGFLTKLYILKATVQTGFYWVAFWSLMAAAIGVVYYLNIISKIYFQDSKDGQYTLWSSELKKREPSNLAGALVLLILLISLGSIYYFPLNS